MLELRGQGWMWAAAVLAAALLAGCASRSRAPAPVEDRSAGRAAAAAWRAGDGGSRKPLPGAENVGKPGYYTVRPGDTLIRISLDSGQNWRDIARWNNIDNPNVIEVGQVLRVIPPVGARRRGADVAPPRDAGRAGRRRRPRAAAHAAPRLPPARLAAAAAAPVASLPPVAADAPAPASAEDDVPWAWPTPGAAIVVAGFDEQQEQGPGHRRQAGRPGAGLGRRARGVCGRRACAATAT